MTVAPPPVRPVTLDEIRAARERIRNIVVHTPIVRLRHDTAAPEIWLKLETLQPINAFKIRGAANAVALLSPAERSEEHTSELQSQSNLVCRLLLEKKKKH